VIWYLVKHRDNFTFTHSLGSDLIVEKTKLQRTDVFIFWKFLSGRTVATGRMTGSDINMLKQ
jgi:hypothetical protein